MELKNIGFFGVFGSGNLGNECTLQALIYNVRKYLPNARLISICTNPSDVIERHKIAALTISQRSSHNFKPIAVKWKMPALVRKIHRAFIGISEEVLAWMRTKKILKNMDVLIMSGTGMLTDYGEGILGFPYHIFKWSLLAKLCNCKLFFICVGAEPTRTHLAKWFIKSSLKLSDYNSFRDHYSMQYMEKIGFATNKCVIYPDVAFSLPKSYFKKENMTFREKICVGVGLMNYHGQGGIKKRSRAVYSDYIKKMAFFVMWLLEHDYRIRILIGDFRYDGPVLNDLKELIEGHGFKYKDCEIIDEPAVTLNTLLSQIASTNLVVSPRYHNVILSLMLNRPVLSISYNEKNDAVMERIGLEEFCLKIENFGTDELIRTFTKLEKKMDSFGEEIKNKTEKLRDILEEQYQRLFDNNFKYS
jgi:polysaccharide pyruvyl transferase WcaK-like protein